MIGAGKDGIKGKLNSISIVLPSYLTHTCSEYSPYSKPFHPLLPCRHSYELRFSLHVATTVIALRCNSAVEVSKMVE